MFCAFLVKQLYFLTIVFPAPWHILFILRCSSHCRPGASGKLLLTASSPGGRFPCRARASVNATLCGFFHVRIEARLSAEFRGMPVEHLVFIAESRYLHGRDLPCRGETCSPGHSLLLRLLPRSALVGRVGILIRKIEVAMNVFAMEDTGWGVDKTFPEGGCVSMSRSKGSRNMWALKSRSFPSHSVGAGLFGAL